MTQLSVVPACGTGDERPARPIPFRTRRRGNTPPRGAVEAIVFTGGGYEYVRGYRPLHPVPEHLDAVPLTHARLRARFGADVSHVPTRCGFAQPHSALERQRFADYAVSCARSIRTETPEHVLAAHRRAEHESARRAQHPAIRANVIEFVPACGTPSDIAAEEVRRMNGALSRMTGLDVTAHFWCENQDALTALAAWIAVSESPVAALGPAVWHRYLRRAGGDSASAALAAATDAETVFGTDTSAAFATHAAIPESLTLCAGSLSEMVRAATRRWVGGPGRARSPQAPLSAEPLSLLRQILDPAALLMSGARPATVEVARVLVRRAIELHAQPALDRSDVTELAEIRDLALILVSDEVDPDRLVTRIESAPGPGPSDGAA